MTLCVLPQVVGEVTSSVTVTALPGVYGLLKAGRNGTTHRGALVNVAKPATRRVPDEVQRSWSSCLDVAKRRSRNHLSGNAPRASAGLWSRHERGGNEGRES
jgi:hypothetical protein